MTTPTGWDTGLSQDYDKGLSLWFASRIDARHTLRRWFGEGRNKMSDETTQGEAQVRPCAWKLRHEAGHWNTLHAESLATQPEWVQKDWAAAEPLYDQAALDAAVEQANARQNASWRLMCERMVAAERERGARSLPDTWLVKVRRLVTGFEHVSGLARLWEPDYSTGSERALWARATEACADVAKLMADAQEDTRAS